MLASLGRFRIDEAWLYMFRDDNVSYNNQYMDVYVTNTTAGEPGTILTNESVLLDDVPIDFTWWKVALSSPVIVSTNATYWVIVNGSKLVGDRVGYGLVAGNPYPLPYAVWSGTWSVLDSNDLLMTTRGIKLAADGAQAWQGTPESLACNVTVDADHTSRVARRSILLNSSDVRDGNVLLSFEANLSASATVSWTWLFAPLLNATETNDETPLVQTPWVYATESDWLIAYVALLLLVILLLALIHGRKGLVWGLVALTAFSSAWMLTSLRFGVFMVHFIARSNVITMRYGWYLFWQSAIAISTASAMAALKTTRREGAPGAPKRRKHVPSAPEPRKFSLRAKIGELSLRTRIGLAGLAAAGVLFFTWIFLSWALRSYLINTIVYQNHVVDSTRALVADWRTKFRELFW